MVFVWVDGPSSAWLVVGVGAVYVVAVADGASHNNYSVRSFLKSLKDILYVHLARTWESEHL